jgi:hypothetical protein
MQTEQRKADRAELGLEPEHVFGIYERKGRSASGAFVWRKRFGEPEFNHILRARAHLHDLQRKHPGKVFSVRRVKL